MILLNKDNDKITGQSSDGFEFKCSLSSVDFIQTTPAYNGTFSKGEYISLWVGTRHFAIPADTAKIFHDALIEAGIGLDLCCDKWKFTINTKNISSISGSPLSFYIHFVSGDAGISFAGKDAETAREALKSFGW